MPMGGFEEQPRRGGPLALRDPAPGLGLMNIWLNLSELVPLSMNAVSCEGILLFEQIPRAS